MVMIPVTLKGTNYLLWARLAKTALGGRGLWEIVEEGKRPKKIILGEDVLKPQSRKLTPAVKLLRICVDTLHKVYGNQSNIGRVFEVKRAINTLSQEDTEFSKHFGKFRFLWAELEMFRPAIVDPEVLNERREQDKVFALLFTLNPAYGDLIKHILRSDKLPSLEEVCAQVQKEQGSVELFGGKREFVLVNQAEGVANKGSYKHDDKNIWVCDNCKKKRHGKDKCWILHPHLKPQKLRTPYHEPIANLSSDVGEPYIPGTMRSNNAAGEGKALTSSSCSSLRNTQDEAIKQSDIEALIKILKDNSGNKLGTSLHASNCGVSLNAFTDLKLTKPLVIDSGVSHHMISDQNLIKNIVLALGNLMIANGDRVPIKDIETSRLLGKGVTKGDVYLLEDTKLTDNLSYALNSSFNFPKDVMWHARLEHPHSRALNIMLPSISFQKDCEACILGKHCKTVFPKSSTIYESCFDLIHSDV
ncbi:hypothetical protein N665_1008s0001 [Sinapis alba]|nr:hypothetical protein N665_1008s0001 [Sinapis alba]